jgi:hypothetical protein
MMPESANPAQQPQAIIEIDHSEATGSVTKGRTFNCKDWLRKEDAITSAPKRCETGYGEIKGVKHDGW